MTVGDELQPMNSEARIAVMQVQIGHISQTLDRIEKAGTHAVPRTEWEQRNAYVDSRFAETTSGIAAAHLAADTARSEAEKAAANLRAELNARRAPWWAVLGAGAGIVAVIAFLFEYIPRIINP